MKLKHLIQAIVREKIFKADIAYMEEQRNFINYYQKIKFIKFLNKTHPQLRISLLEVGSRGGLCNNWMPLKQLNNFYLEGIEPDIKEARKLMENQEFPYKKVHTLGVYSKKGKILLYITKSPGCSSIYKPNLEELKIYDEEEGMRIIKKERIDVDKLDNIFSKDMNFDFINIDIQGAEYEALSGAKRILKRNIGLSFESHLFPLYEHQKLFPDLHNMIKNEYRLLRLKTRTYKGLLMELSDCVYLKNINFINNAEELIKMILFCFLWERKEYIQVLLKRKGFLLHPKDLREIKRILHLR